MPAVDLSGKATIVTGAGAGIGEAVAGLLGAAGAHIVVADLNGESAERVASAITSDGGQAIAVTADVTDPEAVDRMVSTCVQEFGRLDVAVNNAGIPGVMAPVADYPLETWDTVISVNLSSVFYCMRSEIPAMREGGGGAIINMASVMSQVGFPNISAYVAAKHGVLGLTKAASIDHGAEGIRINAVGPTFILTDLVKSTMDVAVQQMLAENHPIKRLGNASEVGELVAWLASDAASLVNGSFHPVDGGWLAQ